MAAAGGYRGVRSSLPFQILLFVSIWYFIIFFVLELALYAFKGLTFPYSNGGGTLAAEIVLVFVLAGLEAIRIFLGWKGNLTESVLAIVFSIIFSIASLFGALYLLLWQAVVLRADVILCAIQLSLIGLELLFSLICIIIFARSVPY